MSDSKHTVWVEKHRPRKVSEVILPLYLTEIFQHYVDSNYPPNMILTGDSGIGKTTTAIAMLKELDADYLLINASQENGKDMIKRNLQGFATSASLCWSGRKYVLLDEADCMTVGLQSALRRSIEEFAKNCGFIFTCNFPQRISDAIHSRCSTVHFEIPYAEKKTMLSRFHERTVEILENEGVPYDEKVLRRHIETYYPDWRKCINELQTYSATGQIDKGILVAKPIGYDVLITDISNDDFVGVENWVSRNVNRDAKGFYGRFLTESMPLVMPSSARKLVRLINQYSNREGDPKLNILGLLDEVMTDVEFKKEVA